MFGDNFARLKRGNWEEVEQSYGAWRIRLQERSF
jgi:hypothetical protein